MGPNISPWGEGEGGREEEEGKEGERLKEGSSELANFNTDNRQKAQVLLNLLPFSMPMNYFHRLFRYEEYLCIPQNS